MMYVKHNYDDYMMLMCCDTCVDEALMCLFVIDHDCE